MPSSKKPKYYGVEKGRDLDKPTIFDSWSKTHNRTSGFPDNKFKGFETLEEAKDYLGGKGHSQVNVDRDIGRANNPPGESNKKYWEVANGRNRGTFDSYDGPGQAKDQVRRYPHGCHKRFDHAEDAMRFRQDYEENNTRFDKIFLPNGSSTTHSSGPETVAARMILNPHVNDLGSYRFYTQCFDGYYEQQREVLPIHGYMMDSGNGSIDNYRRDSDDNYGPDSDNNQGPDSDDNYGQDCNDNHGQDYDDNHGQDYDDDYRQDCDDGYGQDYDDGYGQDYDDGYGQDGGDYY